MNLKAIAQLTRIEHSVILMLGVITAIVLLHLSFTYAQLVSLLLCPFLVSAGAFALNDYFDAESDRINKKKTPIVKGEISEWEAKWLGIALLLMGVLVAVPLGTNALNIAFLFASLSILYDWKLKDVALLGNAIIAASMAIVFIFTDVALSGTISALTMVVVATSFLFGLAREIQKTVQDVEGDVKARGSVTLPVLIGKNPSLVLALLLTIAASLLALWPFLSMPPLQGNYLYLIPALGSIIGLLYASVRFFGTPHDQETAKKISLLSLTLGMVAYLLGGL